MTEHCGGNCNSEQLADLDKAEYDARVAEKNAREKAGIEKTDGY